jgi:endonuclease YncB( thermonuclease family)
MESTFQPVYVPPWWRRQPLSALLLASLIALFALERGFAVLTAPDDRARYHNRVFQVINVVDAVTFDIEAPDGRSNRTRVRLWGVQTAPPNNNSTNGASATSAFAARRLLGRDVRIILAPECTRDAEGQLLAYAHIKPSGTMFNELLLEYGLAHAGHRTDHPLKPRFTTIEERAKRNATGQWADLASE